MSKVKKNKVRHEQDAWELYLMAQELGSVYFKVFTSIEAAAKRQNKTSSKSDEPPNKPIYNLFWPLFDLSLSFRRKEVLQSFSFGLAAMRHLFGWKRPRRQSFYVEIATSQELNLLNSTPCFLFFVPLPLIGNGLLAIIRLSTYLMPCAILPKY